MRSEISNHFKVFFLLDHLIVFFLFFFIVYIANRQFIWTRQRVQVTSRDLYIDFRVKCRARARMDEYFATAIVSKLNCTIAVATSRIPLHRKFLTFFQSFVFYNELISKWYVLHLRKRPSIPRLVFDYHRLALFVRFGHFPLPPSTATNVV